MENDKPVISSAYSPLSEEDSKYADSHACDRCGREMPNRSLERYEGEDRIGRFVCKDRLECSHARVRSEKPHLMKGEAYFDAWFEEHMKDCHRDLTPGSDVYRVAHDRIEKGTARGLQRGTYRNDGCWIPAYGPNDKADKVHFTASFGGDFVTQSHQWKFFSSEIEAYKELAKKAAEQADECRARAAKWDAIASGALSLAKR